MPLVVAGDDRTDARRLQRLAEQGQLRRIHAGVYTDDLVQPLESIVRRELSRFRGVEVDTAGDGFFATFDGPARAVRCALEVRDAVRGLGLEIRAGVHTGECQIIGGKTGGIAVIIGSRVREQAAPGQVLATSTVRDLTAGSGLRFETQGARRLKGVPDEWQIFTAEA